MTHFRNPLVAIQPSGPHDPALEQALRLARRTGGRVTVAAVYDERPGAADEGDEIVHPDARQLRARLDQLLANIDQGGVELESIVLGSPPAEAIRQRVVEHGHDLVLKTSRPHERATWRIFAPLASQLMRGCPTPVWIVPHAPWRACRRVIAAVGLGQRDLAADLAIIELAASLARQEGGELHVVHTYDVFAESVLTMKLSEDDIARYATAERQRECDRLDDFLATLPPELQPDRVHVLKGDPNDALPLAADRVEAELVVLGAPTRSGLRGMLFGNTAEQVWPQLDCGMLVVRPPRSPVPRPHMPLTRASKPSVSPST